MLLTLLAAGCGGSGGDASDYADDMAEEHAEDTTAASAVVREPRIPVDARTVAYTAVGDLAVEGYFAEPARPDSLAEAMGLGDGEELPALIVIHEWWGLNDNIEAMTRRLAGEGYRALAVDLYGGQVASSPDEAQRLMQQATEDPTAAIQNLVAAHRYLSEELNAPRTGSIGWCFGGGMSLNAAVALPSELDAAVIYYGRLGADRQELAALEMPILGIFGAEDQGIPVSSVRAFEETLTDLEKDVEIHIFEGAGHAFANPTGNNYVPGAAEEAWELTTAFFREHLYPNAPAEPSM